MYTNAGVCLCGRVRTCQHSRKIILTLSLLRDCTMNTKTKKKLSHFLFQFVHLPFCHSFLPPTLSLSHPTPFIRSLSRATLSGPHIHSPILISHLTLLLRPLLVMDSMQTDSLSLHLMELFIDMSAIDTACNLHQPSELTAASEAPPALG